MVVKFNEAFICNYMTGESTKASLNSKTSLFQAALVPVHDEIFLVLASSDGTHVFSKDGSEMKFFLPIGVSSSSDSDGMF